MKQKDFEARILDIWMRTRIPLTTAHVQHISGAPRAKVKQWLDQMTIDGVLEADVDPAGEMIYSVRGAERPESGPETVAEMERMGKLGAELGGATRALTLASRFAGLTRHGGGEEKSLIASGALSFFFGPVGSIYAAPLREAIPAIALYVAAYYVLPSFLLWPLLGIAGPAAGLAGVYYAWRHNQTGKRTGLFSDEGKDKKND